MRAFAICWLLTFAGHTAEVQYGEFTPQVKSFLEAGLSVGVRPDMSNVNIHFMGELPNNWVGMCNFVTHDIYVLDYVWQEANTIEREVLLWHELGHCALNRSNKEDQTDNHPDSLMYPSIKPAYNTKYYSDHRKQYILELFNK